MNGRPLRRVVVTGLGIVAANGCDVETFWRSVVYGKSAAAPLTRFDGSKMPTRIAAEIRDFSPTKYTDVLNAKRVERGGLYGIAAAKLAVEDSALRLHDLDPERLGMSEGCSVGGVDTGIEAHEAYREKGYRGIPPSSLAKGHNGAGSGEIARQLGIQGYALTIGSSSASGNDAIGYALGTVQQGEVDVAIAGGAEAPLFPAIWGSLCLSKVMTRHNDDPASAMKPFDRLHDGMLLGEGAAFLVLEELNHALARDAKIYCEVIAHGRSCEAYHALLPNPDGSGALRAMANALTRAGVALDEVDYINAHGTATLANDRTETVAIHRLFGDRAKRVPVSSTKPVTGHLLGAAGALESVVCALSIQRQMVPLTLNFKSAADGCSLDYVPGESRACRVRVALNISSGFGGKNSCIAMRHYA